VTAFAGWLGISGGQAAFQIRAPHREQKSASLFVSLVSWAMSYAGRYFCGQAFEIAQGIIEEFDKRNAINW
jgi:hypothetical protein